MSEMSPELEAVRSHPAYLYNQVALRMGSVAAIVSAVAILLFYMSPQNLPLVGSVALLSPLFSLFRRSILPRAKTRAAFDLSVFLYLLCVFFTQWTAIWYAPQSEAAGGAACMIVVSSLLYISTWAFAFNAVFSSFAWIAVKTALSERPADSEILQLVIMAPVIALLARLSILQTMSSLRKSRLREEQKVVELQAAMDQLQQQIRLRLESEAQLIQAQKNQSLGLMAAGVAHDFNNTLLAISSLAEIICTISKDETVRDQAGEIVRAIQQASGICRQMLTYAGRTTDEFCAVDLNEVVRSLQPLLQASVSPRVLVHFKTCETSAVILGNFSQLQQILMNLVNNSAEATPGRGNVDIGIRRRTVQNVAELPDNCIGHVSVPGDFIVLTVSDTGVGMEPDTVRQIFDPYFTTKKTGHGFGLSTVLGIARSHRAALTVSSRPGFGTLISVFFEPFAVPTEHLPAVPLPATKKSSVEKNRNRTILVVDDEDMVRNPLVRMLRLRGWNVIEAAGGAAAVAETQAHSDIDALIIDFSMPGLNGKETLNEIRKNGCQAPAVLCSGYLSEPLNSDSDEKFEGFLPKPFQRHELETILDRITKFGD